jgi:hypothetical protein
MTRPGYRIGGVKLVEEKEEDNDAWVNPRLK